MWPKLLDLTQDECRGALRRLELESYSNVVGAFRAQGTLNAVKLRILQDLREAFHISEARHKAEVRRVVNDESLSTIAKMIYGPNSEIEWNKEGSRGFLIINRKTSQTALSVVADSASEIGATLNKNLKQPSDTVRDRVLTIDHDADVSNKIVTRDPHNTQPKETDAGQTNATSADTSRSAATKNKDSSKTDTPTEKPILKISAANIFENKTTMSLKTDIVMPKPISASNRRRKSTTALVSHSPQPKAMLLSSRRDTMIEPPVLKTREHRVEIVEPPQRQPDHIQDQEPQKHQTNHHQKQQEPQPKVIVNEVRIIPKENIEKREKIALNVPMYSQNPVHRPNNDVQIIEAIVPHHVDTIKGTRNVMNAISQGAQLVKVIDSKIIKKPVTLPKYITKSSPAPPLKAAPAKQTFVPVKTPNVEYLTVNDYAQLSKPVKAHKIQIFASDVPTINVLQRSPAKKNDIISIPTARNPNIVKTSDKTIMHISQNPKKKGQISNSIIEHAQNVPQFQQKHVIHVARHSTAVQSRTVTIHPTTTVIKAQPISREFKYEEHINDWQNYDPRHFDNKNGYVKIVNNLRSTPNNGRDLQKHEPNIISENVIYDEDIITEEYVTPEEFGDHIIEMEVDPAQYASNDMVVIDS